MTLIELSLTAMMCRMKIAFADWGLMCYSILIVKVMPILLHDVQYCLKYN
jgi:hypothetical protein